MLSSSYFHFCELKSFSQTVKVVSTILLSLVTMYFIIFAFLVSAGYGFCQKNCSQTNPQVMTAMTDLSATSAHTLHSMENSLNQATVEIQLDKLHGSAVIDLTSATDSSDVSLTSLHRSFDQYHSADIDLASMLRSSVYQTGYSSLPTGMSISAQGSSVLPTQKANFSGFSSARLTSLPSQFTGSGVSLIVFDFFNLLLSEALLTAMILIF